jgi:proline dehydrogenase
MMIINRIITKILPYMPKDFVWLFSKRYIAGKNLQDAIETSQALNKAGIKVTIDMLGEFITTKDLIQKNTDNYLQIIEEMEKNQVDGNYSLKPTMFGLLIDTDLCYEKVREVVKTAAEHNNYVRLDMEDSTCTDLEIELFRKLKNEFPANVGIVFQAYLKRTLQDLKNLLDVNAPENPLNIRLCKGIYVEHEKIAYKHHHTINKHFLEDLEFLFAHDVYPAIATHDKALIKCSLKLIKKYNKQPHEYEFQMLYGVTPNLRQKLVDEGHVMRVYVPYGEEWFGYSTRRLKENPKMAMQIIKALFVRG